MAKCIDLSILVLTNFLILNNEALALFNLIERLFIPYYPAYGCCALIKDIKYLGNFSRKNNDGKEHMRPIPSPNF